MHPLPNSRFHPLLFAAKGPMSMSCSQMYVMLWQSHALCVHSAISLYDAYNASTRTYVVPTNCTAVFLQCGPLAFDS